MLLKEALSVAVLTFERVGGMGALRKRMSITRIVSYVIAGSAMVTKATAAAIVPFLAAGQTGQPAVWPNIRGEIERPGADRSLNSQLVELVENATFGEDFQSTVQLSYSMVSVAEVKALDQLWIDTLIRNSGSDTIETFITIRSTVDDAAVRVGEDYLERWVWKASVSLGSST